jgi:methyl-accepting chemotaxis protein
VRPIVALAAVCVASIALVAAGCGGDSEPEASGATQWADGLCTVAVTWRDSLQQIGSQFTDLSSLSQEGIDEAANDVRTATQTFVDELQDLGAPDTESGEEAKTAVDELATTVDDEVGTIEDTVDGISSIADIPAAVTTISSALSAMTTAVSTTVQTIEDADAGGELTTALQDSDACSELSS